MRVMIRHRLAFALLPVLVAAGLACGDDEGSPGGGSSGTPDGDGGFVLPDGNVVPIDARAADGNIIGPTDPDGGPIPFDPDASFDAGGPGGTCSTIAADAAGAAAISGYMDKLSSKPAAGATRTQAIEAIQKTCDAFGPDPSKNSGWSKSRCWALLVAAISKESNYNATVTVKDSYATRNINGTPANDPVVGLLQVRFSSTVHEVVALGALDRLACAGCPIPASVSARANESGSSTFWAVTGPTQHMSLMQNVACNVAMGAWFYFVAATGNGKAATTTYPPDYCKGTGTAGNLITGLRSHLRGFEGGRGIVADQNALNALQGTDGASYGYVTAIKTSWDNMVGPVAGAHPFFQVMPPQPQRYCK
jgi:hypothetical protein